MRCLQGGDILSQEKRKFIRREACFEVELGLPSGDVQLVGTRDISDGGVFILLDQLQRPVIGEVVTVKLTEKTQNAGASFPSGDAVVVRQEDEGVGLAFIELDFNDCL